MFCVLAGSVLKMNFVRRFAVKYEKVHFVENVHVFWARLKPLLSCVHWETARLAPVLKTIFHQYVISYTCS